MTHRTLSSDGAGLFALGALAVLMLVVLTSFATAFGIVPEHAVTEQGVRLRGVGPDSPILYDNDWWFDVFDNNYLWARASLGKADLRGNIVSLDMWDWQKGYHDLPYGRWAREPLTARLPRP